MFSLLRRLLRLWLIPKPSVTHSKPIIIMSFRVAYDFFAEKRCFTRVFTYRFVRGNPFRRHYNHVLYKPLTFESYADFSLLYRRRNATHGTRKVAITSFTCILYIIVLSIIYTLPSADRTLR